MARADLGEYQLVFDPRLERYGQTDLAREIRDDTLLLVERAGFHEYFDPRTGEGDGTDMFSWTAALVIDLVEDDEP